MQVAPLLAADCLPAGVAHIPTILENQTSLRKMFFRVVRTIQLDVQLLKIAI